MPLPNLLAKPVFHLIYHAMRPKEGAKYPPIPMNYDLPYSKHEFLNYICDWRGFVVHGSPLHDLEVLQPVHMNSDKSEFENRQQIFCSPDANWAMWFAILEKSKFNQTRNGSLRVRRGERRIKYYHFELPKRNRENPPFTEGMIYITRAEDFPDKRSFPILDWFDAEIEEWGSTQPVSPLARIHVSPQDFPYLDKVQFSL